MKPDLRGIRTDRKRKPKVQAQKTGALVYCRVSTKEQGENLSLPVQEKRCREYCKAKGWEVLHVFKDKESAKTTSRTEFKQMLRMCGTNDKQIAAVVFYDTTRFSRETSDYLAVRAILKSKGIETRAATQTFDSTPSGEFMETLLAAIGTQNNRERSERAVAGMQAALRIGRWVHRAPIGYRIVPGAPVSQPNLVQDGERAPLIRKAFELYAAGAGSKAKVLEDVTVLGLRDTSGHPLSAQTFDKLLRNPVYAGWIMLPAWGIESRALWEPIVSEDLFSRVLDRFSGKGKHRQTRSAENPIFPLTVFVRCSACGAGLAGSTARGNGGRYSYYTCRSQGCRAVKFRSDSLHAMFVELLYTLAPDEGFTPLFHGVLKDVWRQKQTEREETAAAITRRIAVLEARQQKVHDCFFDGQIDKVNYDIQLERVGTELRTAQEMYSETFISAQELDCLLEFAAWLLERVAGIWNSASAENKRRIQRALFPEGVTIGKEGFGTTSTPMFFNLMRPIPIEESGLASPRGFEPLLSP